MRMHLTKTLWMLAALSALTAPPSFGDDRANPFVRPPTAAEEQARQDERTRNIVREMQPEIKAGVMQDVKTSQASLEIGLRRRIDAVADAKPAAPPAPIAGDTPILDTKKPDEKIAEVKPPEGSDFISCVNGKAMYRDTKDKSLILLQGNGVKGADRCAR